MKTLHFESENENYKPAVPHTVYDCSIKDIEERNKAALCFPSARAAADYIGLPQNKLSQYTNTEARISGKRYTSKKHGGKQFAIRITKTKPAPEGQL